MTLREISSFIASRLDQEYSENLIHDLEFSIKYWRSMLIRRDLERNDFVGSDVEQDLGILSLSWVDKNECSDVELGCKILRSPAVPKPIQLKHGLGFTYIGGTDGLSPIQLIDYHEAQFISFAEYTGKMPRVFYRNGYVYLINGSNKYLKIRGIFDDPVKVSKSCGGDSTCYDPENDNFPMPAHFTHIIIQGLLSGEFSIQSAREEVETDNE